MIALPPLLAGAIQLALTDVPVTAVVTDVGAPGTKPMRKPNLLVEPLPIRFKKGIVHYANFVWLASTVNAALPVLIIANV